MEKNYVAIIIIGIYWLFFLFAYKQNFLMYNTESEFNKTLLLSFERDTSEVKLLLLLFHKLYCIVTNIK